MTHVGNALESLTFEQLESLRSRTDFFAIDVTPAQNQYPNWVGHAYFYQNPWVSSDVMMILRTGLPPAERGLVTMDEGAIWTFPEDYPDRISQIGKELTHRDNLSLPVSEPTRSDLAPIQEE